MVDFLVSSRHAELVEENGQWTLRDLHSTNGTYRNGHRLSESEPLALGDVIQVGMTEILFTNQEEIEAPEELSTIPAALAQVSTQQDPSYEVKLVTDANDPLRLDEGATAQPELDLVHTVERSFCQAWDLTDLLRRIALHFACAVEGRGIAVALQEDGGNARVAFRGVREGNAVEPAAAPDFAVREDLLESALGSRGVLLARGGPDAAVTSVFATGAKADTLAASLALCVSLPTGAGIVGAVYIHDVRDDLTQSDLRLVFLMANLAGVHVRNHQLLTQLRQQNERLAAANRELEEARARLALTVEERTAELGVSERQRRLLALIVENVQEAVVSTNLDGEVTTWNPGASAL